MLANVAPAVLSELLGRAPAGEPPEGAQLKINMLLRRLPRLRDPDVAPEDAFAGTFHVNEGYEQLQRAYDEARAGAIPALPPCELYCHSLTDPSILDAAHAGVGAHTLTLFGLHMPARLFAGPTPTRPRRGRCERDAALGRLRAGRAARGLPVARAERDRRASRR